MSKTLPLIDHLLSRGRHLQEIGLISEARRLFEKLAAFRMLPPDIAAEAQRRLSELCLDQEDFARARQHRRAMIAHQPHDPECHHDYARACEMDDDFPDEQALPHYRRAARLEPRNPHYLSDYGALAVRLGEVEQGLNLLRKASRIAPSDPEITESYVDALVDCGREDEARNEMRTAMFHNSGDRRFRDLYRNLQFRLLGMEQSRRGSIAFPGEEPVVLPFVRPKPVKRTYQVDGQILRLDSAEPLNGPTKRVPKSRKKHSQ